MILQNLRSAEQLMVIFSVARCYASQPPLLSHFFAEQLMEGNYFTLAALYHGLRWWGVLVFCPSLHRL